MVFRLMVVNLVDGNSGVDNRWLDGLFLNDGLNRLVHCEDCQTQIKY